jgi:hypothetical protein
MAMVMATDTGVEDTPGTIMVIIMMGTTITVTPIIMTPIMMVAIVTAIRAITSPVTHFQEITSIGPSIQLGLSIGKTGSQTDQQDRVQAVRDRH